MDKKTCLEEQTIFDIVSHSPEETLEAGRQLAPYAQPPCLVLLEGDLGSGKTTLAKGIVSGLGAAREEDVTSPSFTLVHEYGEDPRVYHADLYRVEDAPGLATLGLDELMGQRATVLIEWGERLGRDLPLPRVEVHLEYLSYEERRLTARRLSG